MADREKLKKALQRLHEAKPQELENVKKEVADFFRDTDPRELALAEQELIQEGVGRKEMKRLCDVHLEVMKEQLEKEAKEIKLPPSHPISILMDEHVVIKGKLQKLKELLEKLSGYSSFSEAKGFLDELMELAHFFIETEKHHRREEEGIFPLLEAHGISEPPMIFKEEHAEFLSRKKALYELVLNPEKKKDFQEFLQVLSENVLFLFENLNSHIYKEDNILYPMSLQALTPEEWQDVRKKFDAIGYCCFAPADLKKQDG